MPHLYLQLRACSCIASGNEQTVAFTAAGCSGLRSLQVPLEKCVGWGGSNFICKFMFVFGILKKYVFLSKKYGFLLLRILFSVAEGWHLCFRQNNSQGFQNS